MAYRIGMNGVRSSYRLIRVSLFALLALILIVRVGPICEAVAAAAVPSTSMMPGCEDKGQGTPKKKLPVASCAMPCAAALEGERVADVMPVVTTTIGPWWINHSGLCGVANAPATPPPRTV